MLNTINVLVISMALITISCSQIRSQNTMRDKSKLIYDEIPFNFISEALILMKVKINSDYETHFILDTGAGINVISENLCKEIKCKKSGKFTGKRMTGEEVTLELSEVNSITLGKYTNNKVQVGVSDLFSKLPKSLGKIDGALSLNYFKHQPFSLDYKNKKIIIEDNKSLAKKAAKGKPVIGKHHYQDNISLDIFINMQFENNEIRLAEIDTGNTISILDIKDLKTFDIDVKSKEVTVNESKNETGIPFTRYYTTMNKLSLKSHPSIIMNNPEICFEKIIYEAVIGNDFLKNYLVTFNIPKSEIIFNQ